MFGIILPTSLDGNIIPNIQNGQRVENLNSLQEKIKNQLKVPIGCFRDGQSPHIRTRYDRRGKILVVIGCRIDKEYL